MNNLQDVSLQRCEIVVFLKINSHSHRFGCYLIKGIICGGVEKIYSNFDAYEKQSIADKCAHMASAVGPIKISQRKSMRIKF